MYVSLKNILQVVAGIKENAEIVAVDDRSTPVEAKLANLVTMAD
jgi:hypothetical protein